MNFNRVVPGTIRSAHFSKPPEIRGDGKTVRDYIYVKDAVSAYLLLSEKTEERKFNGEAFNFSNEAQMSVVEIVNKILVLMGKQV